MSHIIVAHLELFMLVNELQFGEWEYGFHSLEDTVW